MANTAGCACKASSGCRGWEGAGKGEGGTLSGMQGIGWDAAALAEHHPPRASFPHPPPTPPPASRAAQALATYLDVLSRRPACVEALQGCSQVYKASSLLSDAVACLRRALAIQPEAPGLRPALAAALTDLGTAEKLAGVAGWRARYVEALEVQPGHAQAHYNLGVAAGEAGQPDKAAAHYRAAVAAAPACAEAWCNLGVILRSRVRGAWWFGGRFAPWLIGLVWRRGRGRMRARLPSTRMHPGLWAESGWLDGCCIGACGGFRADWRVGGSGA